MKPKFSFVSKDLEKSRINHLYRRLVRSKITGPHIIIDSKKLLNLCSNDYLGMPSTPVKIRQMQSSSRLVSGNDELYIKLEKELARHRSCQNSLVYPTGYMANTGVIPILARKGDLILSDELNHASIIESCKLAGAKTVIYAHNDMDDLQSKIAQVSKNKFIITEGVFSMDGDFAALPEIVEIAQKSGAIIIIDDAHGDFVVGSNGKGTPNLMRVTKKIDVHTSSLSKGLGSFGGYVSSKNEIIDLCINRSRPFIYTSALPSSLVDYSLKRLNADRERYRKRLQINVKKFTTGLRRIGYKIKSRSHIMPIIIGDEKTTLDVGEFLYDEGLFVQPIRYPTVPKNSARLRISVTASLTKNEIEHSLRVFEMAAKRFGI